MFLLPDIHAVIGDLVIAGRYLGAPTPYGLIRHYPNGYVSALRAVSDVSEWRAPRGYRLIRRNG